MPLLTIVNLSTSEITIQDPTGQSSLSLRVRGSATLSNQKVSLSELSAIEPLLNQEADAGNLTWTTKDDPASEADNTSGVRANVTLEDDFLLAAGATLPLPLVKAVQNSATGDYLANTAGGVYSLATAAVSEAEAAQLTCGDQLVFDPTKGLVFEARVRVNIPGATITADERWVVGLVSAHATAQTALDGTTINAWFRGEGANLNIYVEGDDNTTNTDDVDSGVDYADNTWMLLKIDMSDITAVKFSINENPIAATVNMAALTSSNLVQPILCYQRDAGSEINLLECDWLRVSGGR